MLAPFDHITQINVVFHALQSIAAGVEQEQEHEHEHERRAYFATGSSQDVLKRETRTPAVEQFCKITA